MIPSKTSRGATEPDSRPIDPLVEDSTGFSDDSVLALAEGTGNVKDARESLFSVPFEIGWADVDKRNQIMRRMRLEKLQTMNLRTSATARLFYLAYRGETIGWAGLDLHYNPQYPEFFSLYLVPKFRRYTVGTLLELARLSYAASRGVRWAYVRMAAESNYSLLRYRIDTRLFEPIPASELDPEYIDSCTRCELYRTECRDQVYLRVDVERMRLAAEDRLQLVVDADSLPRLFKISDDIERTHERDLHPGPRKYHLYWV